MLAFHCAGYHLTECERERAKLMGGRKRGLAATYGRWERSVILSMKAFDTRVVAACCLENQMALSSGWGLAGWCLEALLRSKSVKSTNSQDYGNYLSIIQRP